MFKSKNQRNLIILTCFFFLELFDVIVNDQNINACDNNDMDAVYSTTILNELEISSNQSTVADKFVDGTSYISEKGIPTYCCSYLNPFLQVFQIIFY